MNFDFSFGNLPSPGRKPGPGEWHPVLDLLAGQESPATFPLRLCRDQDVNNLVIPYAGCPRHVGDL